VVVFEEVVAIELISLRGWGVSGGGSGGGEGEEEREEVGSPL